VRDGAVVQVEARDGELVVTHRNASQDDGDVPAEPERPLEEALT
jgi:hypothetical protein